ncbi:gephyrin isoform X2 [Lepeophtheirus salmonis]
MSLWNVGILTISDTRTDENDTSGKFLFDTLNSFDSINVKEKQIIADDISKIREILTAWTCDSTSKFHLILTTGGTGLSPRDVTPEATSSVIERRASGLEALLLERCRKDHPFGSLSRLVAGTRNNTLIINFPGSIHAVKTCLNALIENRVMLHAIEIINEVQSGHDHHKHHHHHHHHRHHHHQNHLSNHKNKTFEMPSIVSRPRQSEYQMYEVHEAVEMVLKKVSQLYSHGTEKIKDNFYGRILSENIYAKESYPNTPVSIKDGYAVISSDTESVRFVTSSVEAGNQMKRPLKSGQVARITTGAPLPPGSDAVVQVEDTEIVETTEDNKEEKLIRITSSFDQTKSGTDVRATGSDIKQGLLLFSRGVILKSAELGVLCTAGIKELEVYKIPKISILSTGNELIHPSNEIDLPPGFIRDSNKTYLKTLLQSSNYCVYDAGIAKDNIEDLSSKIQTAFDKSDVLITTGGVSMGEKDLLKNVLVHQFGAEIVFGRVFMKPGKPMTFAVIPNPTKPKFIFALPGNPVSTAVTTEIFVLPALRSMKNESPFPPSIRVTLSEDIILDPRPEFKRTIVTVLSNGEYQLSFTGNQISSRLLSCVGANGLIRLPPKSIEVPILAKGSKVEVILIGPLQPDPNSRSLLSSMALE